MPKSSPLKVVYTYPVAMSFVRNDEALLKEHFNVSSHHFLQVRSRLALSFIQQFFFLIFHIWKTDVYVSFFAGYATVLPTIFSKLSRKPHIIILGGTDCVSFPEINYGNYRKRMLGAATRFSLMNSTHLVPVDESLVDTVYNYMPVVNNRQGYKNFSPGIQTPYTVIPIGYDPEKFYCRQEKVKNSFLTVGQMNNANYYRKGIDLIFEVARTLPDCTFTIVGHTKSMIYPEVVPDNVKLIGFVAYNELREIYASHEFYFQLSIMEGFPSAPCEAMLCECIPITSSVGALPKIVGNAGYILRKKSKDDLQRLISEALESNRMESGLKARYQIEHNFPKSTRDTLINLIKATSSDA